MLENRSFDHLLGYLDHPSPHFDGITAENGSNPIDVDNPDVGTVHASRHSRLRLRVDPDHAHEAVMTQLRDAAGKPNQGFVTSYTLKATDMSAGSRKARRARFIIVGVIALALVVAVVAALLHHFLWTAAAMGSAFLAVWVRIHYVEAPNHFPHDGPRIMRCRTPSSVPALSDLARHFAVCTRWFCSVPGETWPNRQFAHAATSHGTVDIEFRPYTDRTIFELLEDGLGDPMHDWRIFYDGPAQALCYPALWKDPEHIGRWYEIQDLYRQITEGDLPAYSFVEPNHGYIGRSYNQHPGSNKRSNADFRRADRFIASIYEALRTKYELFSETLLIVTYDEHGGTFDHVPPPAATPPDEYRRRFPFDRYGPRVPAILISPWIPDGRVVRRTLDHASIPASLRERFVPSVGALTARDANAQTFLDVLSLDEQRPRDTLPNLARTAWRPKAVWTPIQVFQGWWRGIGAPMDSSLKGLAQLARLVDEALPEVVDDGATLQELGVDWSPTITVDEPGILPPISGTNRPRAARAVKRFGELAAAARSNRGTPG
jgi:phospholipase C